MTFFAPENLLWLAALLPPLVLLYFLKIKRQPHVIPSIMLWHKSLHDLRANAPFQRLRRNLLLLLQILVLLLFIAAVARPIARGSAFSGRYVIILVDRSASMGALDEGGSSRLDKALEIARSIADDPEKKEVMVISFSTRATVECPFTTSPADVRRALERIEPTQAPTRVGDALLLAASAAKGKEDVRVVLLSDGAVGPLPAIQDRSFAVDLVAIGQRCRNVAITGLSVRRPLDRTEPGIHLFVEVTNFNSGPVEVPLEIRHEETLVNAARWTLPSMATTGRTFRFPDVLEGLLSVRIEADDDLDGDDTAAVVVLPPKAPRILLVTDGNVFLQNALRTIPGVQVTLLGSEGAAAAPDRGWDIAVYDGTVPEAAVAARAELTFGMAPPGRGAVVEGVLATPLFGDGDWNDTHPVNRYADYSGLFVNEALKVKLPEDAVPLLESRDGPLMAAFAGREGRAVAVFFDIHQSDWAFQVSFPVFLSNAVFWLYGGGDAGTEGVWHRTGEPIPLPPGGGRVTDPAGESQTVTAERDEPAAYSRTEKAGIYRFEGGDGRQERFPVNLVSAQESNLAPVTAIEMPGEIIRARASRDVVYREYWPWLLVTALALLVLEWWVYHRRAV